MRKQILLATAFILLTLTISLSACGRDAGEQLGIDGYVYVAEKIELPQLGRGSTNHIKVYDDTLYFFYGGGKMCKVILRGQKCLKFTQITSQQATNQKQ